MRTFAALVILACAPAVIAAQGAWAHVTYLSGGSVYVDAGTKDGVKEGSRLEVMRGEAVVATLVVAYVSSSRASCTVATSTADPVVGDSVFFVPEALASPGAAGGAIAVMAASTAGPSGVIRADRLRGRVRGRFGVRYLVVDPGAGAGRVLTQPAFDLRLDGQQINNSPVGIAVDVRAQRSLLGSGSLAVAPDNVTRVYQAALAWNPVGSPTRVTVGRQYATALSTLGLYDGVAIDVDAARWSAGVLGGLQPDPVNLGLAGDVRQYGAYVQAHNTPGSSPLWSLTTGGVGAYNRGQIDREFAYLRLTYSARHLSVFAAQELDVNRGWRATAEGSATTPTSTFAIAQLSVTDWLSVNAGMDNRRNVRLYRDFISPETIFDDTFREGHWGGASLTLLGHFRLSSDARQSSGGTAGKANSVTNSVTVSRLTPLQVTLRGRDTRFTGDVTTGQLQSASFEVNPMGMVRIEFTAGRRESANSLDPAAPGPTRLTWTSLDADVGIGRSVYLMISTSRETGALEHNLQTFAALSYRF